MSDIKLSEWCKDRNTGCSCGNKFAPSFIKKIEVLEKQMKEEVKIANAQANLAKEKDRMYWKENDKVVVLEGHVKELEGDLELTKQLHNSDQRRHEQYTKHFEKQLKELSTGDTIMSEFTLKRKAVREADMIYNTQSEFSIKRTLAEYYLQKQALEKEVKELYEALKEIAEGKGR